jgi:hypothetical protein
VTLQIFDTFDQQSDEWRAARMGIPTASRFADVLAKGEGKSRRSYLLQLAGEIVSGEPMESYRNAAMDRGTEQEGAARDLYRFLIDYDVRQVGFIRNGAKGASPDALVGASGLLELKSAAPNVLVEIILKGSFPAAHVAQCQGGLWVAEREWVEIMVYHPRMTPFRKKAYRDEPYIRNLAAEIDRFNTNLAEMVETVRRYGEPSNLRAALEASISA